MQVAEVEPRGGVVGPPSHGLLVVCDRLVVTGEPRQRRREVVVRVRYSGRELERPLQDAHGRFFTADRRERDTEVRQRIDVVRFAGDDRLERVHRVLGAAGAKLGRGQLQMGYR